MLIAFHLGRPFSLPNFSECQQSFGLGQAATLNFTSDSNAPREVCQGSSGERRSYPIQRMRPMGNEQREMRELSIAESDSCRSQQDQMPEQRQIEAETPK